VGAKLRVVRRRIRSVQSTKKITRAMELIASSRIVKAQQRVEQSRPYAVQLTRAMEDVARQTGWLVHALVEDREAPWKAGVRVVPIAPEEVSGAGGTPHAEYLFEPGPESILDHLLPQYVITKVYAALLESAASENASRRRAMKAATDNAEDLIKILTRQANRARQDEITTEISEIVGGAEALAQTSRE